MYSSFTATERSATTGLGQGCRKAAKPTAAARDRHEAGRAAPFLDLEYGLQAELRLHDEGGSRE
jgi:hypothetical protein